jgi:spermidine synthase
MQTSTRSLVLWALLLSGFAGLMHEIVWARLLVNLIGNTAHAQAVVLTVFMGGLAIGAVLFGRGSDRGGFPLRTYVRLEIGIAIYCAVLPWIVGAAGGLYDQFTATSFESPGAKIGLRFALALVCVSVPAILMGGTLPVLARVLVREIGQTRRQVASLYSLNNLGAVIGAGVAGFYALPHFGITLSLIAASSLNLLAALLVWMAARQPIEATVSEPAATAATQAPSYGPAVMRITLLALALSGFAAMGYEVVFTRVIALSFGASAHSFTVMLMGFIGGIGLGSALMARQGASERPLWLFGASQAAVVLVLAALLPAIERLPYWIGLLRVDLIASSSGYGMFQLAKAALVVMVLLLPTMLIGMGFPLVAQIQARSMNAVGRSVGTTYAWNTVGNVLGILATSLVLIPSIGIGKSILVLLFLNALAAAMVLLSATQVASRARLAPLLMPATGLLLALFAFPDWSNTLNRAVSHLRLRDGPEPGLSAAARAAHPASSFASWKKTFLVVPAEWQQFFLVEESDTTVLAVARTQVALLFVNSKGDASTGIFDMVTQLLLGHLPMFSAQEAKSALVIGLGSGVTCGSALLHGLERMDVVEISSGVLNAEKLFSPYNNNVLADPRVKTFRDDARTFLRTVPRKYDVIISEPSNPWIAGIGNLFTQEFFEAGAARLNPGGVMCIWFHQYEQSDAAIQLVIRTVHAVFPHVSMYLSYNGDVIAIASLTPQEPDFERWEQRFERPEVRKDLGRIGVFNLAMLFTHHAVSPEKFAQLGGQGPLNRDLFQRLEYLAQAGLYRGLDAQVISRADGFLALPDGGTDSLLERYTAWRKAQGAPLSKLEFERSSTWVRRMLVEENHRLVRHVLALAKDAEANAHDEITTRSRALLVVISRALSTRRRSDRDDKWEASPLMRMATRSPMPPATSRSRRRRATACSTSSSGMPARTTPWPAGPAKVTAT